MRLLQRTTRAVALTEAGETYRQALGGLLAQAEEAERAAVAFHTEAVGRLRISAPPDLGPAHLAPVIARYLAVFPGVRVELELSTRPVDLIAEGFDLAIRGALAVEPSLVTRQVGLSPIVVCASPAYLEAHGTPGRPEELAGHACLHFAGLRWGRAWHFAREGEAGPETVRVPIVPRLEANDGPTLVAAALAGAGIALEPAFVVGPAIRDGRLRPILPDWSLPEVPLHAVYPASRHIAQKVRRFVTMTAGAFAQHPDLSLRPSPSQRTPRTTWRKT